MRSDRVASLVVSDEVALHRQDHTPVRAFTLSQQLGVLCDEAVVSTLREGKNIYHSLADKRMLEMLSVLYRIYCLKE